MASELVYGVTKTIPYRPDSNGYYEYTADGATPIWYRYYQERFDPYHPRAPVERWEWTPDRPPTDNWSPASTSLVKHGFWRVLQNIGLADLAELNKMNIGLLDAYKPRPRRPNAGSNPEERNANQDRDVCYDSSGIDDHCLCESASCYKDLVASYDAYGKAVVRAARRVAALDALQFVLDLLGLIPGFGIVFDLINAALYAIRGMVPDMIFSLLSAIPVAGHIFTGIKLAFKGARAANSAIKAGRMLSRASQVIRRLGNSMEIGALLTSLGNRFRRLNIWNIGEAIDELKDFGKQFLKASDAVRTVTQRAGRMSSMLIAPGPWMAKVDVVKRGIKEIAAAFGCKGAISGIVFKLGEALGKVIGQFKAFEHAGFWLEGAMACMSVCTERDPTAIADGLEGCAETIAAGIIDKAHVANGLPVPASSARSSVDGVPRSSVDGTPRSSVDGALEPRASSSATASVSVSVSVPPAASCGLVELELGSGDYTGLELCSGCAWAPRALVAPAFAPKVRALAALATSCGTRVLVTSAYLSGATGAGVLRTAGYGLFVNVYGESIYLCNADCMTDAARAGSDAKIKCVLDGLAARGLRWRGPEGASVVDDASVTDAALPALVTAAQRAASSRCYEATATEVDLDEEFGTQTQNGRIPPPAGDAPEAESCRTEAIPSSSQMVADVTDEDLSGPIDRWTFLTDADQQSRGNWDPADVSDEPAVDAAEAERLMSFF